MTIAPGPRLEHVDDLLDRDERPPRRQQRLLLHAGDPPQHHVAGGVGLLGVDDRDVGVERRDGGELLAGERAHDRRERGGVGDEVGAAVAAQHGERQAGRAGGVAVGHPGVAVLLDLQRPRPAVLDGVAEAVQRADAGVAAPREDQLAHAAGADQLVVDDVGRHPHDGQVAPALADDLLPGGDGDEVGEPFEGDGVAVVDQLGDRGRRATLIASCHIGFGDVRGTRSAYSTQSARVCVK